MSDYEMNDGQCFIYAAKKEGNKPTMKGKAKIDGVEYEISLWPSKSGKPNSYSGKIALPFKAGQPSTPKQQAEQMPDMDIDDPIPF